ncbi:MAG: leucine-rich repeat protein [Clostridia bacterium]|nr:leucine-rich repeat protein [Clostridia bacterium]
MSNGNMCCEKCGGNLTLKGDVYVCHYCNSQYADVIIEKAYKKLEFSLREKFGDIVQEEIVKREQEKFLPLLRQLWEKSQEKYIDSKAILSICSKIKDIYPDHFLANFYEVANSGTVAQINEFLNAIDVKENAIFVEDVVSFLVKSLEMGNVASLNYLVERAYKNTNMAEFESYSTMIESEAQKVNSGLYKTDLPRDVFIAYSSKDLPEVLKLVEVIESQGLTCFLAMRNLRHGRGSVANYEAEIQKAIDNSGIVIFISSRNSRCLDCDAIKVEIPYIKKKDLENIPLGYKNNYADVRLLGYKKPRIEYRLDNAPTILADRILKEFFAGLEYTKSVDDTLERIASILTDGFGSRNLEEKEQPVRGLTEEELRKMLEQMQADEKRKEEERIAEEKRKAEEEAKRLAEEKRKAEEEAKRLAEEKRKEAKRLAEEKRKAEEEAKRLSEERHLAEEKRLAEIRLAEETKRDCIIKNGNLLKYEGVNTKVVIPDCVTKIDVSAFCYCRSLTSVVIPNSVTSIGEGAFESCDSLTSVYYTGEIEDWCNITFSNSSANPLNNGASLYINNQLVTELVIPNTVTEIKSYAFYNCGSLTSVVIPNSVKSIGEGAFEYCDSLTSVVIGDSVTSIGSSAFSGCYSLTSAVIGGSVTSIGTYAFYHCESLTSVVIGESVTTISRDTFMLCYKLAIYYNGDKIPRGFEKGWDGERPVYVKRNGAWVQVKKTFLGGWKPVK